MNAALAPTTERGLPDHYWEEHEWPMVVQVDDQLIVFRLDRYAEVPLPQCVARGPAGDRCDASLLVCGTSAIQILGADATVTAYVSPLPSDCFLRQRCPAHVHSGGDDAIEPEGEPFDPGRHADALHYLAPRWSPEGVWTPPDPYWGRRVDVDHSVLCPFGDHVPLADSQADELENRGIWPDRPSHQQQVEAERARWATLIGDHIPELAALLGPAEAPPDEAADVEVIPVSPTPAAEPIVTEAEECPSGPTALYRYFDADDLLLYVGISDRLRIRTGSHVAGSSWMDFAVRSTIERHPTRAIALEVEEAAIKAEHPLFNHQHNDTPEARRALVGYLVKHDRLDLLAPAVSRG